MKRVVVAVLLVVVAVAVALFVIAPWPDPNHQTAEQVVRNAGVPPARRSGG